MINSDLQQQSDLGHTIWVINGPNLDQLGRRDTSHYGACTLGDIEIACTRYVKDHAKNHPIHLHWYQSACEGEIIGFIHQAYGVADGLIINGGAYSHTSLAIMDALSMLGIPIIEVHLSQIYKREAYRQHSYISKIATGVIAGFRENSYILGLQSLITLLSDPLSDSET